jgi:hypothetical protein
LIHAKGNNGKPTMMDGCEEIRRAYCFHVVNQSDYKHIATIATLPCTFKTTKDTHANCWYPVCSSAQMVTRRSIS